MRGLSRGMMQRLGLGRSILHRPKLLLLDEPASGLDPLARRDLFELLRQVHSEGTTVIISSHILGELSDLCTSVAIMHDGRFLEVGRTAEIIRKLMPKREITIQVVTPVEAAAKVLQEMPGVSDLSTTDSSLGFFFEGSQDALAGLNAALVRAKVGVALLEEKKTNLHDIYFKIAERNRDAGTA